MPQHLLDALATVHDRFDAIIVDEGQDFADIWWVTLESLLAEPAEGVLYIFYDNNQRIFETHGDYPIPPPHFTLTENCRTTQAIHRAATAYLASEHLPSCRGPEGRSPVELPVTPDTEIDALCRVVHGLTVEEGLSVDDIVVLSPRGPKTSRLAEGTKLGNLRLSWLSGARNVLRCRSIQAFKGLESSVVILAEPERAHEATLAPLLHVGLTRAQHHVIVLGNLPVTKS